MSANSSPSQFGLLNPLIAIFVGLGIWLALRSLGQRRNASDGALVFLLALCLPLIAYMAVHSLHARVQGNWLAPVYPGLALLGAIAAAGVSSRFLGGLAKAAAPVGIVVSVLVLLFFVSPLPTPFGQRTPAERLVGWSDLAERCRSAHGEVGCGLDRHRRLRTDGRAGLLWTRH